MPGVLSQVDLTFRVRDTCKYNAVNSDGFEVDIVRREQTADDPRPIRLSDHEDDFRGDQAPRARELQKPSLARRSSLCPTAKWLALHQAL